MTDRERAAFALAMTALSIAGSLLVVVVADPGLRRQVTEWWERRAVLQPVAATDTMPNEADVAAMMGEVRRIQRGEA